MRNQPTEIAPLITSHPDIHGGRPCIQGTGTTVHEIVARSRRSLSLEEVAASAPNLNLDGVRAAVAYYRSHQAEIEGDFQADEELGRSLPPIPAALLEARAPELARP